MTLGDDPIELMQGCLFTASYDGQLRGENLKTDALQKDIKTLQIHKSGANCGKFSIFSMERFRKSSNGCS